MELILLSIFGIASLFVLEFCRLFFERRVSEPHLTGSQLHAAPSANQARPEMLSQLPSCSEAANDADATTIVRVRSRRAADHQSAGE
jgi:hypothetical protein